MILPIYIYGHPVLRKKCLALDKKYPNLDKLIFDMFETMHNASGIGISAPQIGLSIRLFVIDLTPYHEEDPSIPNIKKAFINPEIIYESDPENDHNEGCLSIPGVRADVTRKSKLKIHYLIKNSNLVMKKLMVCLHEFFNMNTII